LPSVQEELRAVEQHLVARMDELRPMVAEYHELESLAKRLGVDTSPGARPTSAAAATRAAAPRARKKPPARKTKPAARRPKPKAKAKAKANTPSAAGTRQIGAQRREQVLTLIRERPGITVPDISKELGVDAPPLYRVIRKLQSERLITKTGKALQLT
jgi:Winged helix-turn-helix DNA-binding